MKKKIKIDRCILEECNKEFIHPQYKGRPPLFCCVKCREKWKKLHPDEEGGAYGYVQRNYS